VLSVIHVAEDDFKTLQEESEVTAIEQSPCAAENVLADGLMLTDGCAACVTMCVAVKDPFVTIIVPERRLPLFGSMEYNTVPSPFPPVVFNEIHESEVVAVHEQLADTENWPFPATSE
jgi:hypothetical protein